MLGHRQCWAFFLLLSHWLTYSLLVLHNVIPPMLLGEVRRQHIKTSAELREHHVIRVTCTGECSVKHWRYFGREADWISLFNTFGKGSLCFIMPVISMGFKLLPHLACRSGVHQAAWSHAAEHGARLHPAALSWDLQAPLEPHIPHLWTGIHSEPSGHLPWATCSVQSESWTSATYQEEHPGKDRTG